MRRLLLAFAALLAATAAGAQAPASSQPSQPSREPLEARRNQKIERITHEDAGSRIDEVRHGSQTERITVQPKANVPAYEVQPSTAAQGRPADNRDRDDGGGRRTWRVLGF